MSGIKITVYIWHEIGQRQRLCLFRGVWSSFAPLDDTRVTSLAVRFRIVLHIGDAWIKPQPCVIDDTVSCNTVSVGDDTQQQLQLLVLEHFLHEATGCS